MGFSFSDLGKGLAAVGSFLPGVGTAVAAAGGLIAKAAGGEGGELVYLRPFADGEVPKPFGWGARPAALSPLPACEQPNALAGKGGIIGFGKAPKCKPKAPQLGGLGGLLAAKQSKGAKPIPTSKPLHKFTPEERARWNSASEAERAQHPQHVGAVLMGKWADLEDVYDEFGALAAARELELAGMDPAWAWWPTLEPMLSGSPLGKFHPKVAKLSTDLAIKQGGKVATVNGTKLAQAAGIRAEHQSVIAAASSAERQRLKDKFALAQELAAQQQAILAQFEAGLIDYTPEAGIAVPGGALSQLQPPAPGLIATQVPVDQKVILSAGAGAAAPRQSPVLALAALGVVLVVVARG